MKYNIFTHGMFTHYVPKTKAWKAVVSNVAIIALVGTVGTLIAYSVVMFGNN